MLLVSLKFQAYLRWGGITRINLCFESETELILCLKIITALKSVTQILPVIVRI